MNGDAVAADHGSPRHCGSRIARLKRASRHVKRDDLPMREQIADRGRQFVVRQTSGWVNQVFQAAGCAAKINFRTAFIAGERLKIEINFDSFIVGRYVGINGSVVFFGQHFQTRAVCPKYFVAVSHSIAVAMHRLFIPAIFDKAVAVAYLVNPHHLTVIQTRRKIMFDVAPQPRRSDGALVRQINVWNGHLRPKARLTIGNRGNRCVRKIPRGLKNRGVNVSLRRFDVTLVVQSADHIADHFAIPLHERVGAKFADGRVQVWVVRRAVAQINIWVNRAPDDRARGKLRQALGS